VARGFSVQEILENLDRRKRRIVAPTPRRSISRPGALLVEIIISNAEAARRLCPKSEDLREGGFFFFSSFFFFFFFSSGLWLPFFLFALFSLGGGGGGGGGGVLSLSLPSSFSSRGA